MTWQLAIGGVLVGLGIYLVASGRPEAVAEPSPVEGRTVSAEAGP